MSQLLTVLPLLACPLGMGLMMWFMSRSGRRQAETYTAEGTTASAPSDPRRKELEALRAEVEELRAEVGHRPDVPVRERTL
ncbi:hypothetical protein GCM10019016_080480 [Streptomyces prasinosporus]|uniref:DUF2933 domain-containing protein n=2 Tax=Streptomyces TaxID=1883 RepID=A0ABP6U325_9ACTN|nr:hypothetical protein [Streptomyces tricolor]MCG0062125.1 hypothetical protein [Streptomyces tricolor]GHC14385.1 hypothetical protein GCM10010332_50690 [Streptomyces albogriseolus]